MEDLEAILLCQVQDRGFLESFGNFALTPLAYFFHGRKVEIFYHPTQGASIHHVATFHPSGFRHTCRTRNELYSDSYDMKTAALMILFLVPGMILGLAAKLIAYASSSQMRWETQFIKSHFTPIHLTIGSLTASRLQIEAELNRFAYANGLHPKIDALEIRSRPDEEIVTYMRAISVLNPKKLILHGSRITNPIEAPVRRFDDVLAMSGKWLTAPRRPEEIREGMTHLAQKRVRSVQEALDDVPPRRGVCGKLYHALYVVEA